MAINTFSGGNPINSLQAAGKNAVINGGMDIWQRGTSISVAASSGITYTADRWCLNTGANQAMTISRQATGDTTNLPNIQYCTRYQRNSGQTGTGGLFLSQSIESVNSIPLAGQTVTMSFYARKGANYSAASSALTVLVYTGTGTDQNQLSGFTGSATPISGTATLTTTWQRFTFTGTIASTVTEIASTFYFTPVGTAGAADYYEVTGVQLELGSTATTFSRAGGTIQGELAACQRYYQRYSADGAYSYFGFGSAQNTSTVFAEIPLQVQMRIAPTTLDTSATSTFFCENSASVSTTSLTTISLLSSGTSKNAGVVQIDKSASFASGTFYRFLANNSTSAYVGFSAEL